MRLSLSVLAVILVGLKLSACTPKVGSPSWCEALSKRPRLEWTAEEVKTQVRACVLGQTGADDD